MTITRFMAALCAIALISAATAWKVFEEPRLAAIILMCGAAAMFAGAIWRALR